MIAILIPALLILLLLWLNWDSFKQNRILLALLVVGTVSYYGGLFIDSTNPGASSLLKLIGMVLLFAIALIQAIGYRKQQKESSPD